MENEYVCFQLETIQIAMGKIKRTYISSVELLKLMS